MCRWTRPRRRHSAVRPIGRGNLPRPDNGPHPPFLFCLAKRETGRARSKEKIALPRSGTFVPPRGRGSPELVPTGLAGHLPARAAPCGFQSFVPRFWCGGHRGGHRMAPASLLPARGMPHLTAPRRTRQRLAERKARRSENIKCDFSPHPLSASRRGDRRTSLNKPPPRP